MKNIKVLYVTSNSFLWGDNRALLNIIDNGISYGITPFVIMAREGDLSKELDKRKINYRFLKNYLSVYPPLNSLRNVILFLPRFLRILIYNKLAEKNLKKIVYQFKPDIIHSNVGPVHIGMHVARKCNIPHIWHIREYQDLHMKTAPLFTKKEFIKKLQYDGNHNIAISQGLFNHFEMKKNSRVIYDGVLSSKNVRFNEQKENYFLFVGRLCEGKGLRDLINAFIKFSEYDNTMKLVIAGSGSKTYINDIKKIIQKFKLESRIIFLGFRNDVFELMEKATALIVPSHYEGFGFITVEAMFNGCLVIGNNTGGTKEILEKENLGLLYSTQTELVSIMISVVKNGIVSYFPMIKKAQQRATQLYSIEQNGEAIYQYYKEIIKINI